MAGAILRSTGANAVEGEGARFAGAIQGMLMVAGLALSSKRQDPIISDSRAMTAQLMNKKNFCPSKGDKSDFYFLK